jgi:hypothetical protein
MSEITDKHREFHNKFFEVRKEALGDLGDYDHAMLQADEAGLQLLADTFPEPTTAAREPVAWLLESSTQPPFTTMNREIGEAFFKDDSWKVTPLYAAPQEPQISSLSEKDNWNMLTLEERMKLLVADLRFDPAKEGEWTIEDCYPEAWSARIHCADRIERELQIWKAENPNE